MTKIVLPGESLAFQEEFVAGKNAFDGEDGAVYSDSCGKVSFDNDKREVSVKKKRDISTIKVGSIVFGKISMVKTSMAVVEITGAFDEKSGKSVVFNTSMAGIPVRNIANSYVKSVSAMFKIGDFVKAKVSMVSPYAVDLRTSDSGFGVIKAFCSKCRHELHLFGQTLKCTNCGSNEERKISSDYSLK